MLSKDGTCASSFVHTPTHRRQGTNGNNDEFGREEWTQLLGMNRQERQLYKEEDDVAKYMG